MEKVRRVVHAIAPYLVALVFAVALGMLYGELKHYHLHDIRNGLAGVPATRLGLALALTLLNYAILVGYDVLAVREIGHPLALGRIALASFTGFVTSYNFGTLLGGTSFRYRLYSAWGLSAVEILRLVLMLALTFWIGLFALAGIAFVLDPFPVPPGLPRPFSNVRYLGVVLLVVLTVYLLATVYWSKPARIRDVVLKLPSPRIAVLQIIIAAVDLAVAAAALYVLLPVGFEMPFLEFLGIYLLAVVVVVFSHVPGGLGVFELVVLKLAGMLANEAVVGALLIFRVIYYLIPLLVAALLLGVHESMRHRAALRHAARLTSRATSVAGPQLLALATFASGAILLFSGALPALQSRISLLERYIPLPLVEASHFFGSLTGAALLVLAFGLRRRLDSAWWLTSGLLGAAVLFSLLKGFDFEEAGVLSVVLVVLLASRHGFYRKGSLLHARFSRGWVAAILLVVACSAWLAYFAHRHAEYTTNLWWEFAFESDAPRSLRATAGVAVFLFIVAVRQLVRPHYIALQRDTADLELVNSVVKQSPRADANLALLGDKSFFFNESRSGFIMYAIQGRSWVALGDPVATGDEFGEIAWGFRELVDSYDGWPVFYEVGDEHLAVYIEQGMTLFKLGEEGRVPLDSFGLEGGHRKGLRQTHNRLLREACNFDIVAPERVPDILPRLREISDAWLSEKHAVEKGFSLGFFNDQYLMRFPCAVVRQENRIIAFANLWQSANKEEMSVDLMRYHPESPSNVMEFLFIELMLWARQEGYRWFNIGMAPLSGIENRPLAPFWNRVAELVYRHGEQFYGFQGLRQYKEKFDPVWRPRFLASQGGLALPRILADVAALINNPPRLAMGPTRRERQE